MTASSNAPSPFSEDDFAVVARESEADCLEALNLLRQRLGAHKLSSPLQIIQSAIAYIRYLEEQLQEDGEEN
ncbi:hypothetical protein QR680_005485 [Steinernema hermaphroditum]|uniref:Uncharacterized protein n=1 Tax=Steinernema hermaphroditum TaxID=289476 RepID=A0AA39LVR9_9BILA|nr:hypothetical protein QR680_005485 [Steinernema hermaphroditum]